MNFTHSPTLANLLDRAKQAPAVIEAAAKHEDLQAAGQRLQDLLNFVQNGLENLHDQAVDQFLNLLYHLAGVLSLRNIPTAPRRFKTPDDVRTALAEAYDRLRTGNHLIGKPNECHMKVVYPAYHDPLGNAEAEFQNPLSLADLPVISLVFVAYNLGPSRRYSFNHSSLTIEEDDSVFSADDPCAQAIEKIRLWTDEACAPNGEEEEEDA